MAGTQFTDAQREAIRHVAGNLQLIACAGSGKTEVVAQRVVNLLRPTADGGAGCRPENIVAFTFTDKAAAELKERIHTRCREQLGERHRARRDVRRHHPRLLPGPAEVRGAGRT